MIKTIPEKELSTIEDSYNCVVIQTTFETDELNDSSILNKNDKRISATIDLIENAANRLENGGLLYIFGLPKHLSFYAVFLNKLEQKGHRFLFKYWISIECKPTQLQQPLPNSHIGMLMYLKTSSLKNPTPFKLKTKEVRIPYSNCHSCKKNVKDWGGKKHLMNPIGSAISDVWSDFQVDINDSNVIPKEAVTRIYDLLPAEKNKLLFIQQTQKTYELKLQKTMDNFISEKRNLSDFEYLDKVVNGDCNSFMNEIAEKYPQGMYDLVFADPPYNLEKKYAKYDDDRREEDYINWCNEWLDNMTRILRPGGALVVLNIPKWSVYHFVNLAEKMAFRHWMVWDALSTPSGKFLPAHYSLLYFTKPGGEVTSNHSDFSWIDSRKYCLRASCVKTRKRLDDDDKELLSDIWRDVHRIKHKKDRDNHPCQLPNKLMERIINLFTDEGDLVFDPFGGAGTTAIAAKMLNRHFTITELDPMYVDIAQSNLARIRTDSFGYTYYERPSAKRVKKTTSKISNKQIEQAYIDLCLQHKRTFSMEELSEMDKELHSSILDYRQGIKYLKKIGNRFIENAQLLNIQ